MKYLVIIFSLINLSVYSQKQPYFEYQQGKEYKPKLNLENQKVIGIIENEIIAFCGNVGFIGSNHSVSFFDKNTLEYKSTVHLRLFYDKKPLELHEVFIFNNTVTLISSYVNQSKNIKYFFLQTLLENGVLSVPKIIGETDWSNVTGFFTEGTAPKGRSINSIKYCLNADQSKIAIVYPDKIFSEELNDVKWNAILCDTGLNEMFRYEFSPKSTYLFLNQIELGMNDNIYGHSIVNPKFDPSLTPYNPIDYRNYNSFFGKENFLEIIDCAGKNNIQVRLQDIGEHSFVKMTLINDKAYFIGINSIEGKMVANSNVSCFDNNGNEVFNSIDELPDGFFKRNKENKKIDQKYFQLDNKYEVKGPFILEDGSFFVLAEKFDIHSSTMNDVTSLSIVFDDLVILYYSNVGELVWSELYQKTMRDANGFLGSYLPFVKNNRLNILTNRYFSDVQQFCSPETYAEKPKLKGSVTVVTIEPDGKIKTEVVLKNQIKNVSPSFRYGLIYNDETFYSLSKDEGFSTEIYLTTLKIK